MIKLLLQDTFLLATQQEVTLTAELAAARAAAEAEAAGHGSGAEGTPLPAGTQGLIRRRLFCHRSPTDNLLVAMGRWMDNAIPLVPNRYQAALAAGPAGALLIRSAFANLIPGSLIKNMEPKFNHLQKKKKCTFWCQWDETAQLKPACNTWLNARGICCVACFALWNQSGIIAVGETRATTAVTGGPGTGYCHACVMSIPCDFSAVLM